MSEGPSDPDLLDLDDLPDTARVGVSDPLFARALKALHGLSRWAKRQHAERKSEAEEATKAADTRRAEMRELRLWFAGLALSALTSAAGLLWQVRGVVDEVHQLRDDMAEHTEEHARTERAWHRVDTSTHATEEP